MANYVSAMTTILGPKESLNEFLRVSTATPTGEICIISLGGIYHEPDRNVARVWDCEPPYILDLIKGIENSDRIAYSYECAWGAPDTLTQEQSEKYPKCLFILSQSSSENWGFGTEAWVAGKTIFSEYFELDDFVVGVDDDDEDEDEEDYSDREIDWDKIYDYQTKAEKTAIEIYTRLQKNLSTAFQLESEDRDAGIDFLEEE